MLGVAVSVYVPAVREVVVRTTVKDIVACVEDNSAEVRDGIAGVVTARPVPFSVSAIDSPASK
jgi:hypothetical protein